LERFKMRNTWLGNLQGSFEGTATRLFIRGILLWLLTIGPLVACLIAAATLVDVKFFEDLASNIGDDDALKRIIEANPGLTATLGAGLGALLWTIFAALFLYPAFEAITLRWWLSGVRFGQVTAASKMRIGQIYGIYLRFIGWSMLFGMIGGIMAGM